MAKDDNEALQAAALEEIRKALYEPKTTLPKVRRRVAHIFGNLREALGEKPEPIIVRTSDRPSVREVLERVRKGDDPA